MRVWPDFMYEFVICKFSSLLTVSSLHLYCTAFACLLRAEFYLNPVGTVFVVLVL
jgi:hypothetical protein